MVSRVSKSSPEPNIPLEVLMEMGYGSLISKIKKMKVEIEADRVKQIREKLDKSGKKLRSHINQLSAVCIENSPAKNSSSEVSRLSVENALCILDGSRSGSDDKDIANIHEVEFSKSSKFPKVQRIPPYTTWIFLDRNQRMAEDQTVVGRRRIYYDQSGSEALICSDSDDDMAEMEEEKREFSEGEDQILWMAFREHGFSEDVAEVVSHFIGGTSSEILEHGNELKLKFKASCDEGSAGREMSLEKSLSAASDSFDNLFCRRCLVFDCRLHGCSQILIYPSEKQSSGSEPEDRKPCSNQCYLLVGQASNNSVEGSESGVSVEDFSAGQNERSAVLSSKQNIGSNNAVTFCGAVEASPADAANLHTIGHTVVGKRKTFDDKAKELESTHKSKDLLDKKLKTIQASEATIDTTAEEITMGQTTETFNDLSLHGISRITTCGSDRDRIHIRPELKQPTTLEERRRKLSSGCKWKPLEKDLYMKGLEIFGRNSCLIARNLLSGLKTCAEVSSYMHNTGAVTQKRDNGHSSEDCARSESDPMEQEVLLRHRSRIFRKKGRARRLKYSSKSNGHPSSWKRIGNGNQSCKQYTPCSCQFMCGKDCSCLLNGTCCEKYCGCSKSCKNRFRGCHCAKSQCRSRQCPCFAANRECDPDVCRNCWVSCGGGSLGEPAKKGEGQCGNMRLLLRQQQRVLLGRSDVAGWGAFINKAVNKHEYLGEYTGELVSHREADKRGKIYDRANSSFLFDLNDQYVLDACRQGDKLKFANHSSKPNCYCKVMLVAGDHRVGIFAKERIEAKEELFYDYRYGPDQAPAWARKPGAAKKGDSLVSVGRARKHQ